MSTSVEKRKRRPKAPEGRVVIGKNIPIHWGKSDIVAWEVHLEITTTTKETFINTENY